MDSSAIFSMLLGVGLLVLAIFLAMKDIDDEHSTPVDPVVNELRRQWWANQVIDNANRQADLGKNHHHYR
jgi:hypothetical protein